MSELEDYFRRVGTNPSPLVQYVLQQFVSSRGSAVDLGAGNLRDARYLLASGFKRVVAVDSSEKALEFEMNGVEIIIAKIEEFHPDETFDFAFCHNTLYFLDEQGVRQVLDNVFTFLTRGGIFAFTVLGVDHRQTQHGPTTPYYTRRSLVDLCSRFKILGIGEERGGRRHTFGAVVQKP